MLPPDSGEQHADDLEVDVDDVHIGSVQEVVVVEDIHELNKDEQHGYDEVRCGDPEQRTHTR